MCDSMCDVKQYLFYMGVDKTLRNNVSKYTSFTRSKTMHLDDKIHHVCWQEWTEGSGTAFVEIRLPYFS